MKQYPIITITILILLLTSCSTPVVAPTPTSIESPNPNVCSVDEAKTKLEAITMSCVSYQGMSKESDCYEFSDSTYYYTLKMTSGDLIKRIKKQECIDTSTQKLSLDEIKKLATKEVKKLYPSLFNIDVQLLVESHNNEYNIDLFQTLPSSIITGNNAKTKVKQNGDVYSIYIQKSEDVSKQYSINEEQAIEIAYQACAEKIQDLKSKKEDLIVNFDARDEHDVKVLLHMNNSTLKWSITISFSSNLNYHLGYIVTINANTGEIISIDGFL